MRPFATAAAAVPRSSATGVGSHPGTRNVWQRSLRAHDGVLRTEHPGHTCQVNDRQDSQTTTKQAAEHFYTVAVVASAHSNQN